MPEWSAISDEEENAEYDLEFCKCNKLVDVVVDLEEYPGRRYVACPVGEEVLFAFCSVT